MLVEVIGGLLPSALGVALSPVPIIAIVLMLGSDRARSQGPAFALGWIAALVTVSTVLGTLAGTVAPDDGPSPLIAAVELLFGILFLGLAVRQWRSRRRPDEEPAEPAWMASVGTLSVPRTAAIGGALAGLNPKNLALSAAASADIAQAGLDVSETVIAIAVFVVLGSCTVLGPVLIQLLAPQRSAEVLEPIQRFMAHHNDAIMVTVLLVLGAKLLGNGLAGL
jgi:threonine/homoserine/homoserine lactone efflux protein